MKRILFVCTGNTCRSPLAEALFRDLVKSQADYEVSSAGVAAAPGMPMSKHSAAILKEKGLSTEGFQSQMLDEKSMAAATHVFAMTRNHAAMIEDEFPDYADKVYLVSEFAADDAVRGQDVSDPFGGGRRDYDAMHQDLQKMLPNLVAYIDQTHKEAAS